MKTLTDAEVKAKYRAIPMNVYDAMQLEKDYRLQLERRQSIALRAHSHGALDSQIRRALKHAEESCPKARAVGRVRKMLARVFEE